MIQLKVNHEMFAYDMYHMVKAFYPGEEIEQNVERESLKSVQIVIEDSLGKQTQFTIQEEEMDKSEDRS